MDEITNISGVSCYEENGTAYLLLEDVARGLGFTKTEKKNGKKYASVRWERVFSFLDEFGFAHKWAKDSYIPENIFYRLAMKAKNETAERFQALVADEIIPSIRKHGAYMTEDTLQKALTSPDFLIQLATTLKEEQQKRIAAESKVQEMEPKVEFYDHVADHNGAMTIDEAAKVLNCGTGEHRLFKFLRKEKYLMDNNLPYQWCINRGYFRVIEKRSTHRIYKQTLITQKGITAVFKKLLESGKVASK